MVNNNNPFSLCYWGLFLRLDMKHSECKIGDAVIFPQKSLWDLDHLKCKPTNVFTIIEVLKKPLVIISPSIFDKENKEYVSCFDCGWLNKYKG